MLPEARATTTLRRTVPLLRWTQLEPILVTKLKRASESTAIIGGTLRKKIRTGSKSTPPPTPVIPIRVPTTKPIKTFSMSITNPIQLCRDLFAPRSGRVSVDPDESLTLQMQNDLLRCLFGTEFGRIDHNLGIRGLFVRVRNARELLENASASLGIQTLTVALFTGLHRGRDVNQNEAAAGLNHAAYGFASGVIRSDGSADRDATVLGYFGGHIADTSNIDIAMLLRETQL